MTSAVAMLKQTADVTGRFLLLAAMSAFVGMMPAAHAEDNTAANAEPTVSASEWSFTKQVNEVHVLFLAGHDGKAVPDLSQNDITVRDDNKAPAAVLGFRTEKDLPLRVGVLIDTSSSVNSRFRFEQAAASLFLRQAVNRSGDLAFVMGFNNHTTVTQDFSDDPTLLAQGVQRLKADGGTAMYDAIRVACQKLRQRPESDMVARVLVLLTDGQNNAGEANLEAAIDAAQAAEVTIYAISTNYPTSYVQQDLEAIAGNKNLHNLVEQTGGRLLTPPGPKQVEKAFVKIGEELRSRYAVSYRPADFTENGHYRKIKIEARKDGHSVEVRARKGYYARTNAGSSVAAQVIEGSVTMASR